MQLCIDCKFYQAGATEDTDICQHEKATFGGVRGPKQMFCAAMRMGPCFNAALFQPATPVALEQTVGVELPNPNVLNLGAADAKT